METSRGGRIMGRLGIGDTVQRISTGSIGRVTNIKIIYNKWLDHSVWLTVDYGDYIETDSFIELYIPAKEVGLLVGDKVRHITLDMTGIVKSKCKRHDMGLIYLEVEIDSSGGCYLGAPESHWVLYGKKEEQK